MPGPRHIAPIHLTGGITRSPLWMQVLADVLGERLSPVEAADASAIGAAMLGQWALGGTGSLEEVAGRVRPGEIIDPDQARHAAYARQHKRWQKIYPAAFENPDSPTSGSSG